MQYQVIKPEELDGKLCSLWDQIQRADPRLASPYFNPEFTLAVSRVRSDVRITIIQDGGHVVGFFPFQLGQWGAGRPVGGAISDYHGLVADSMTFVNPRELLRASGLTVWEFDHLVAGQAGFSEFANEYSESPIIDLSDGYVAYCAERQAAGSQQIKKTTALARKLEREHGPIDFEARSLCRKSLDLLMDWKSAQCAATGTTDVFGVDWTRRLMRHLMEVEHDGFGGMLSTLSVRGRTIAAHFGMRSWSVWHYWFPSYDNEFAMYSPGLVLLLRMAATAPEMGLTSIDLGKGSAFYKSRLANRTVPLLEGRVETPSMTNAIRALRRRADRWIESGRIARAIGLPLRALRRMERQRKYV